MIGRLLLAMVLVWTVFVAFPHSGGAQGGLTATLTVQRGVVAVLRADGTPISPAGSGLTLGPGDQVGTVGRAAASIRFSGGTTSEGTTVELGSETTVVVKEATTGERIGLTVAFGTAVVRTEGRSLSVTAGNATALARHATFALHADQNGDVTAAVGEGEIEFPAGTALKAGSRRTATARGDVVSDGGRKGTALENAVMEPAEASTSLGTDNPGLATGSRAALQGQSAKPQEQDPPKQSAPAASPSPVPTVPPTPPAPTQTVLIAAAAAGATRLEVASTSGFGPGDVIRIAPDTVSQEDVMVFGVGSILTGAPLRYTHQPGETVFRLSAPPDDAARCAAPATTNDAFANAVPITLPAAVCGDNTSATVEPGEPTGSTYRRTLWYRLTPTTSGMLRIAPRDRNTPGYFRRVTVFTGPSLSRLTFVAHQTDLQTVQAPVTAGQTYYLQVADDDTSLDTGGPFEVHLMMVGAAPTNDDFAQAQIVSLPATILANNLGATSEFNEPSDCFAYQRATVWYRITAPTTGTMRVSATGNQDIAMGLYQGRSLGNLTVLTCDDESDKAPQTLTSGVRAGETYLLRVVGSDEAAGPLTLRFDLDATPPPSNDAFANAAPLTVPTSFVARTVGATLESGECARTPCYYPKSVWYRITAPSAGTLAIRAESSEFLPRLSLLSGTSLSNLEIASIDTASVDDDGPWTTYINAPMRAGQTLLLRVAAQRERGGSVSLQLEMDTSPTPANDHFEDAAPLATSGSASGSTRNASVQNGEPSTILGTRLQSTERLATADSARPGTTHAGVGPDGFVDCAEAYTIGQTVWYRVTPATSGTVSLSIKSVDYALNYVVYSGTAVRALTPLGCGSAGAGSTDRISVRVTAGASYYVQIGGFPTSRTSPGSSGHFQVQAELLAAQPANDDFANAITLPASGTLTGSTAGATYQRGEDDVACPSYGAGSVWYRFVAPSTGRLLVTATPPAGERLVLEIANGSSLSSLDDYDCYYANFDDWPPQAQAGTAVAAGDTAYVRITGAGQPVAFTLQSAFDASPGPPNDAFSNATLLPVPATVTGTTVNATAEARERGDCNDRGSVWYLLMAPGTGLLSATATTAAGTTAPALVILSGTSVDTLRELACDSADDPPTRTHAQAGVTVGKRYYIRVAASATDSAPFSLAVTLDTSAPGANDRFSGAQAISVPTTTSGSLRLATVESGEPAPSCGPNGHTHWFKLVPAASGAVTLTVAGDDLDTVLAVYVGDNLGSLAEIACDDDARDPRTGLLDGRSTVTIGASGGQTYYVQVGVREGTSVGDGTFTLTVSSGSGASRSMRQRTGR